MRNNRPRLAKEQGHLLNCSLATNVEILAVKIKVEKAKAELEAKIEAPKGNPLRWMVMAMITQGTLIVALVKLFQGGWRGTCMMRPTPHHDPALLSTAKPAGSVNHDQFAHSQYLSGIESCCTGLIRSGYAWRESIYCAAVKRGAAFLLDQWPVIYAYRVGRPASWRKSR